MRILVVDDDRLTLSAVEKSLHNLGHEAILVRSGEEAIAFIQSDKYDLILSDIMMPGISGLSFVSVLRTVHLCHIPILMMSTLHHGSLLDAAFKAGANDFINKPFTENELSTKLNKFSHTLEDH